MTRITSNLRQTTKRQKADSLSKPFTSSGRRYMPTALAPSLSLSEEHDCSETHPDFPEHKSITRIFMSAIRFYITQVLQIQTYRGKTKLQSGRSTCGGCESAHFALTPTMHDGKLQEIIKTLEDNLPLSDHSLSYIAHRLDLSEEQIQSFSQNSSAQKLEFLDEHMSPEDRHNSFSDTSYETQLSGTIQGSKIANDFDQLIEKRLRPIEDSLSDQIYQGELEPQAALQHMYLKTCEVAKHIIMNLETRKTQIQTYQSIETQIHALEQTYLLQKTEESQLQIADQFFEKAKELLEAKAELTKRLTGSMNFDKHRFQDISTRTNFYHLTAFVKGYDLIDDPQEKIQFLTACLPNMHDDPHFGTALEKIDMMLSEATHQLEGIESFGECQINRMTYWLFGVTESGVRRAPTEKELFDQILNMTKKEFKTSKRKQTFDFTSSLSQKSEPKKRHTL